MIKKLILRIVVLIVVFFTTIVTVNQINNAGTTNLAAEMEQATLPLVYMMNGEEQINCLHGYVTPINIGLLHDSITPLGSDQKISFWLEEEAQEITKVDYQVRSADGTSLVEEGTIEEVNHEKSFLNLSTKLRMDLKPDQEYYFVILAKTAEERTIYYYTRIMVESESHIQPLMRFIKEFHAGTFDKENPEKVATYIEPDATGINDDLGQVTIHSNYESITWGNLHPMRVTPLVPTIKEIEGDYLAVTLEYVVSGGDTFHQNVHYNVREFYRVRYVDEQTIYLMDYNRTMEAVFDRTNLNPKKNWYQLGIADINEFQYRTADDNKKVAFVKEGQLWLYDYPSTTMTKVFSFWQDSAIDVKTAYNRHGINIMNLADDGTIDFTVYGYMNRGKHEGENGIAVYHYNKEKSQISEVLFVKTDVPYEALKEDAKKFSYLTANGDFYYLLDDAVYKINTKTMEASTVLQDIPKELIGVSFKENLLAYPNAVCDKDTTSLYILNLDTGETSEIKAAGNERLKALGFIEDDLICGIASQDDIVLNKDGSTVFPMYKLQLTKNDQTIVKEYQKSGIYVMDASVQRDMVYLERVSKHGTGFTKETEDFITFKNADEKNSIALTYSYSYDVYNELYMVFPSTIYATSIPDLVITKETILEDNVCDVTGLERSNRYYVYAMGRMLGSYSTARAAMQEANDNNGVAIGSSGNYIYKLSGLQEYATVEEDIVVRQTEQESQTLAACLSMILDYEKASYHTEALQREDIRPDQVISELTEKNGVDLLGCNMDIALYFLSNGAPIIAKLQNSHYVLIVSYNANSLRYIDPLTGESIRKERSEIEPVFEAHGNEYYSYVR